MKNLKELVKVFDNYIEFEESLVRVEEIVAIRAHRFPQQEDGGTEAMGIEIITPYERFVDSTETWKTFLQRLNDMKEAMAISPEKVVTESTEIRMSNPSKFGKVVPLEPSVEDNKPSVIGTKEGIPIEDFAAIGQLNCKKVVNRDELKVCSPTGRILGSSDKDGQIRGDLVKGVVMTTGSYRLAFDRNYAGDHAVVMYQLEE